jgi:hypothetical protein
LREEEERLGADINASGDGHSTVTLALTANLAPSPAADRCVRHPAFAPAEVARVKQQRLASLAQTMANPRGLALRAFNPILFGAGHPYGHAADGLGMRPASALHPEALRAAHAQWLRPDLAPHRGRRCHDGVLLPRWRRRWAWKAPASPWPVKAITPRPPRRARASC